MHDIFLIALEITLEFLCEMILSLICEFGVDLIAEFFSRILQKNPVPAPPTLPLSPAGHALHKLMRVLGFTFLGSVFGTLSLIILPHPFIHSQNNRIINLILTPTFLGYIMEIRGQMSRKKRQTVSGLDHYVEGFFFALGLVSVRFFLTH